MRRARALGLAALAVALQPLALGGLVVVAALHWGLLDTRKAQ